MVPDPQLVDQTSSSEAKIALFRSLFRGREDVYPRRFESRKTGKSGYAPACANEWVRGICEKPRIKCAECPNRRFLPVTDDVIRWHLSGRDDAGQPFVAGVYPMLLDETCFFLAVDFDKSGWLEDATAFIETCRRLDLPAALERSRSGRGGHVWLFFEEAMPAALARRLGSHILTETMERRPDIGLDSYDRFFPNQDTLPHGGFGNLIALPLQKHRRGDGNSVFLDDHGVPHARSMGVSLDACSASGARMVEGIVRDAERRGRVLGVRLPPRRMTKTTAVDGAAVASPDGAADRRRAASIARAGPRQPDLHRQGRIASGSPKPVASPGGISESGVLQGAGDAAVDLRQAARSSPAPRITRITSACRAAVSKTFVQVLTDLSIRPVIRDERYGGQPLQATFQGELRPEQKARGRRDAEARHRCAGRHDGVRQDGGCRVAHRPARRQHAGARASASAARPVDRAARGVPRPARQVDRSHRRRPKHSRPGCSTWPSFRASSGRASWTIASPSTAT